MKQKILIIILVCLAINLCAKSIIFRSGEVMSAEISTLRPVIENFDKSVTGNLTANVYAAVTVKLSIGRLISIYDYALFDSRTGKKYQCIAIRQNNGNFQFQNIEIGGNNQNDMFTLLFECHNLKLTDNLHLILQANFPPKSRANCTLTFKNIGKNNFTPISKISKNGMF